MRRLLALLVVFAAVPACHPMHWTKPGFSAGEFQRDTYECERDVRAGAASFGGNIFAAQDFYNQCLAARGYSLVPAGVGLGSGAPTASECEAACTALDRGPDCFANCNRY
jgi:hypothetical protein